jgi:hypothetical protein
MKAQKPKPKKKSAQRLVEFAEGGSNKMFFQQAAGPDKPGNTGKDQSSTPGAKRARGGPRTRGYSLALPAQPGHTAPIHKGRGQ